MERRGPRVAGIDPGTVSFEVCGLDGGQPILEASFATAELGADPAPLVDALRAHAPFDLVLGPAGYGLPLVPAAAIGERELALMVLKRAGDPEGRAGIGGMRSIVRALIAAGIPLVFGPGAIHLPTVPDHRKWNRIDLGTADKVASAALGIADQAERLGIPYAETRFVLLELGGGFSAALAVAAGQIVDGFGGSAGPSARARAARSTRRWPISSAARSPSAPSSAAERSTRTESSTSARPARCRGCARIRVPAPAGSRSRRAPSRPCSR